MKRARMRGGARGRAHGWRRGPMRRRSQSRVQRRSASTTSRSQCALPPAQPARVRPRLHTRSLRRLLTSLSRSLLWRRTSRLNSLFEELGVLVSSRPDLLRLGPATFQGGRAHQFDCMHGDPLLVGRPDRMPLGGPHPQCLRRTWHRGACDTARGRHEWHGAVRSPPVGAPQRSTRIQSVARAAGILDRSRLLNGLLKAHDGWHRLLPPAQLPEPIATPRWEQPYPALTS